MFENSRRAKNGHAALRKAGHRSAMCGNVAAKQGDASLLFNG